MAHYYLSFQNTQSQFIQIKAEFITNGQNELIIHLPRWRPGRYEIQNFAQRIKGFSARDTEGNQLPFKKTALSSWSIDTRGNSKVTVSYEYHAALMDAGNTWLDAHQLYVNPVNCLAYEEKHRNEPCQVELELPEHYQIATGLAFVDRHTLSAPSYNILVDSPFIASDMLREVPYEVNNTKYSIWFQGLMPRSDEELKNDFAAFTKKTNEIIGKLPCYHYHFLNEILPYKHYHGVEHWNSTVITIGPSEALADRERYADFLGVSCHELFHTWNVIRMRPEEMVPYDFQNENLHTTGFITEGVTTYYGDLILARSGVYSFEEYLNELNKLLKKHFENEGRLNYSVAESSYDLWLDGYKKGIPGRKVSIYNEGALATLILDLSIRKKFDNQRSFDDVLRLMWQRHGQDMTGYSANDYRKVAEEIIGESLQVYFDELLFGTTAYEEWLAPLFTHFGLTMSQVFPENSIERDYGFKISEQKVITDIDVHAPVYEKLVLNDKIMEMTEVEGGLKLQVLRYGVEEEVVVRQAKVGCFPLFQVIPCEDMSPTQQNHLKSWLEDCIA